MKIKVHSESLKPYPSSELSDGQRAVFYFLGQCLACSDKDYIIVDEPEGNLHKSIVQKLWDEIEKACPNTTFIYITHDLDFAVSRKGATKICVESFSPDPDRWVWYQIPNNDVIPELVQLKIAGARKSILFVEGKGDSLDKVLYGILYPDFLVIPLGGCEAVIHAASTFNSVASSGLHRIEAHGIIDRDYKEDKDLKNLHKNIWFLESFAEIENFLLSEEVLRFFFEEFLCIINPQEISDVVNKVKVQTRECFKQKKLDHVAKKVRAIVERRGFNVDGNSKESILATFAASVDNINVSAIYDVVHAEAEAAESDYCAILRIYNFKKLHHHALAKISGLDVDQYHNSLIRAAKKYPEKFRNAVLQIIPVICNEKTEPILEEVS